MLANILVPADFSETSDRALEYGKNLAKKLNSKLYLLHVVEEIEYYPGFVMPPIFEELKNHAISELNKLAKPLKEEGMDVQVEVKIGKSWQQIVNTAKANSVDLIVIGTHGRTGLSHVLLGSIAEKVVRRASCPVMTIRSTGNIPGSHTE